MNIDYNINEMKHIEKKTKNARPEDLREKRTKLYVQKIHEKMDIVDKKPPWKLRHPGY
jgi:hypothetical protein